MIPFVFLAIFCSKIDHLFKSTLFSDCHVTGYRLGMIHLYCLAVQACFYRDVVECSTIDRRVPGSILGRGMVIFLRVRDSHIIVHGVL